MQLFTIQFQSMANRGALDSVTVTMRKHPAMLRLVEGKEDEERKAMVAQADATEDKSTLNEKILYEGPVRGVCALAPNNVNTMACKFACILGFTGEACYLESINQYLVLRTSQIMQFLVYFIIARIYHLFAQYLLHDLILFSYKNYRNFIAFRYCISSPYSRYGQRDWSFSSGC